MYNFVAPPISSATPPRCQDDTGADEEDDFIELAYFKTWVTVKNTLQQVSDTPTCVTSGHVTSIEYLVANGDGGGAICLPRLPRYLPNINNGTTSVYTVNCSGERYIYRPVYKPVTTLQHVHCVLYSLAYIIILYVHCIISI